MKKLIIEKFREIEKKENVKIIAAFESGSRAWGVASPDSDYDVRFIYIRRKEDYLKLEGIRDVLEYPIDDELDINGWDIQKALRLLYKSNPTILEWCTSPIVYIDSNLFMKFKLLLPESFSRKSSMFHYLNMAESNYRMYLKTENVRIKKYFYVLRPILAADWIIHNQTQPPMLFSDLVDSQLDSAMKPIVENLLRLKMEQPEVSIAPKVEALNDYIDENLKRVKDAVMDLPEEKTKDWDLFNNFFLAALALDMK